jgi:hypothetical protein
MALWGNNDNLTSTGTVTLNYDTGVVTGAGTSFGTVGAGGTGDVIRFGDRSTTYFGDAVIVSIAGTESVTIGSTAGLSGAAISGVEFTVSQLPKYTILDSSFSETLAASPTLTPVAQTGVATTDSPVGFVTVFGEVSDFVIVGDSFVNDGNDIVISTVNAGDIELASGITVGISTGDTLSFRRSTGGYDKVVYGVGAAGTATGTVFETGVGWVGVTTYTDQHGNLRVKKEILVAMSGIQTGNAPAYPPA